MLQCFSFHRKKRKVDRKIDHLKSQSQLRLYEKQIETLKEYARDDGYDLHEDSYANFIKFFANYSQLVRADVVLLDNGNLRAIWKGKNGGEIGLQFLTDSHVQYVLFSESGPKDTTSKPYGRGGFEETMKEIKNFGLYNIMFESQHEDNLMNIM